MHHHAPGYRDNPLGWLPAAAVVAVAALVLSGCASSPWSSPKPKPAEAPPPSPPAQAAGAQAAAANSARPDPKALQQVMAELQQMGTLDPAAREELLADLKQTDPNLWPLMMQQFQAAVAYRRQAQQQEKSGPAQHGAAAVAEMGPSPAAANQRRRPGWSCPRRPSLQQFRTARPRRRPRPVRLPRPARHWPPSPAVRPVVGDFAVGAVVGPPAPAALRSASGPGTASSFGPQAGSTGRVVQASYVATTPVEWQAHLAAAIHQLEADSKGAAKSDAAVSQQAYLRMLYLMAGRRDEALSPIPGRRRPRKTTGPSSSTAWPPGSIRTTLRTARGGPPRPSASWTRP